MEIRLFTSEIKEDWDSFVVSTKEGTCYHLSGWKHIFENTYNYKTYYLYAMDSGTHRIEGLLPLVLIKSGWFGRFLVSLPIFDHVGILSLNREAQIRLFEKAVDIGRKENVKFLELRHLNPGLSEISNSTHSTPGQFLTRTSKIKHTLDLPNSAGELWESFKSKLRSQIKKPMKEGLTTRVGGLEEADNFYKVFSENMRDLGTPVNIKALFVSILAQLPDQARICIVLRDHQPVAAGFIIGFKEKVDIPWASSLKKFNHLSPNMLLYWGILEYACNHGHKLFDFGRSNLEGGTNSFKKQWNPKQIPLYWHYWVADNKDKPDLNKENPKFQTFIKLWKTLPLPLANMIGPRIVKYLPQ